MIIEELLRLLELEAIWKGSDGMRGQQVNRVSGTVVTVLSLTALLAVLSGYTQPPQPDEGAAAHIFQLSIVALVPMILVFLGTADWRHPWRAARPLAFPVAALILAFVALYHLEHRAPIEKNAVPPEHASIWAPVPRG